MKTALLCLSLSLVSAAASASPATKCQEEAKSALATINAFNRDEQKVGTRIELEFISESTLEDPIYRYRARYFDKAGNSFPFPDKISMVVPDDVTGCRLFGFDQGTD